MLAAQLDRDNWLDGARSDRTSAHAVDPQDQWVDGGRECQCVGDCCTDRPSNERVASDARGRISPSPATIHTSPSMRVPGDAPSSSGSLAIATVGGTGGVTALIRSPLARRMLEVVLAEPILLSPDERYLHGHYLAYLMSGSRRRGLFLRRPLEPRNADRGRLLLAATYAILAGAGEDAIRDAATLLNQKIEVRPILSPIVVAKYLACRESPAKRKLFRQTRKAIGAGKRVCPKKHG